MKRRRHNFNTRIFYATPFLEAIKSIHTNNTICPKMGQFHSESTYILDEGDFKWHGVNKISLIKIAHHGSITKVNAKEQKVGAP